MRKLKTENRRLKAEERKQMLSEEEVRHIAGLANLTLTDEEVTKFQKQLSETINYIDVLSEIETGGIFLTSQVSGLLNVVREDKAGESLSESDALSGGNSISGSFFKVKAVIER